MTHTNGEAVTRRHMNAVIKAMLRNDVTLLTYSYEGDSSEDAEPELLCSRHDSSPGCYKSIDPGDEKAICLILRSVQVSQNPSYATEHGGGGKITVDAEAKTLKHETFHWDLVCLEGTTFILADGFVKSDDLQ